MGDMGDIFNDCRRSGKKLKQLNYNNVYNLLENSNLRFDVLNNGYHIKLGCYDIYPSTLKVVENGKTTVGINAVLDAISETKKRG